MLEPQAPTGYVILEWLERGLVNINTACQNATNDSLLYVVFTWLCFRLFPTTRENSSNARRMKLYSLLLSRTYCQLRDASLRRSNDTRSDPFVAHTDDASMSSLSMSILSQRDVATDLRGLR